MKFFGKLGGVEERDAAFHGSPEHRGHLLFVFGWAVRKAHSHAAEAEGRDFQIALSKFSLLHRFLSVKPRLPTTLLFFFHQNKTFSPSCEEFFTKNDFFNVLRLNTTVKKLRHVEQSQPLVCQ